MLPCLPQDDLGKKRGTFSGLNPGCKVPKPFLDRGGQGCGIISAYRLKLGPWEYDHLEIERRAYRGKIMSANLNKIMILIDNDLKEINSLQKMLTNLKNFITKNSYGLAIRLISSIDQKVESNFPLSPEKVKLYKLELENLHRDFKLKFDSYFLKECEKINLSPLSGSSLKGFKLKGIIQIDIDFAKSSSIIGTNCRKIKLNSVQVSDIIIEIEKLCNILFNKKFAPNDFIEELFVAYKKASGDKIDKDVLLNDIQKELWMKRQKEAFWLTYDKSKMIDYPTDAFSVDLYELIKNKALCTRDGYRFSLSEGANGIVVYDEAGNFWTYKFIKFKK